jgi:hypothetical protein
MSRWLLALPLSPGLALLLGLPTDAPQATAAEAPAPFATFVDDYFDAYFAWKPSEGTAAGLHQYDNALENWSADAVARRVDTLKKLQQRLDTLRAGKLGNDEAIDAEVLDGLIKAELLDLQTVGTWRHNPMNYIGTPASAIDGLMKRNFAPPVVRLRAIIARLKATPALWRALRANMDNPPKEFTDLASRMGDGSVEFYRVTLPAWAKEAAGQDDELPADLVAAWEKAGARVGWMRLHTARLVGPTAFLPLKERPEADYVPAFQFRSWPEGVVPKLPAPAVSFGLDLRETKVTDAGLKDLAGLQSLQVLRLSFTPVTDAGLKELAGLKSLQVLSLHSTSVTDAGLKELAGFKSLQAMDLGGTKVTDEGLKELARLKSLDSLYLRDTKVTDAGVKELRQSLPGCRIYRE